MIVFSEASQANTPVALGIALDKATELSAVFVVPTTSGSSAVAAVKLAKQKGFSGRVVVVSHVWGMRSPGANSLTDDNRAELESAGVRIVTAAHALSGVERSISGKFGGVYPVEIMANTLRMLSQGVKVCVEISTMALDAGALDFGSPVVAIGGTGRGLDTACVITPGYSASIFDTRLHEILCKPY